MKLPCKHSPLNTGKMPPSAHLPPTAFHVPSSHLQTPHPPRTMLHHTLHVPHILPHKTSHQACLSPTTTQHKTNAARTFTTHSKNLQTILFTDLKYWCSNTSTFLPPTLNPCSPQHLYTHLTFSP